MSRTLRHERSERAERPLPERGPITEPADLDEMTEARLKRDFDLSDYPLATKADLVVTPSGRVLIAVEGDELVAVGESLPEPMPERTQLRLV